MNSCLYEINISHDRHLPTRYKFNHKIFMFYLDLNEAQALQQVSWLFGFNHKGVYSFLDSDHVPKVREFIKNQGDNLEIDRITLLTNVRVFGYIFNPVSFYFCFDAKNEPVAAVVEIGNTFGELKLFYLGQDKRHAQEFKDSQVKYYYISPFTDLDNELDFHIQVPQEHLRISIDVQKNKQKFFFSTMQGKRHHLSTRHLLWYTLKFPFVTLKVIFLIHWHAAVLHFIKHVNHHPKEDNAHLQREIYREWNKKKVNVGGENH